MNANQTKGSKQEFNETGVMEEEEAKTMPLGMGMDMGAEQQSLDPLAGAGEARKFRAGSMVIVLVVVMACAGLWFMKTLSKVGAASAGSSDVEAMIDKFIKSISGGAGGDTGKDSSKTNPKMLPAITASYTERQVPLNNVQRNPFILDGEGIDTGPTDDGSGAAKDFAAKKAAKQTLFEQTAARFVVKSIIMSNEPLANISGKIVRKGDELVSEGDNVAFRVAGITPEAVTLVAEDPKLDLIVDITVPLKRDR